MSPPRAYIGLGSNLGDRLMTLRSAARHLGARPLPGLRLTASSPIYESHPVGPARHAFLNAVVELRGELDPERLLTVLLELEELHGRRRRVRWGPRTLDLDLLLVVRDGVSVHSESERLTLPHPGIGERDFVLAPLAELDPELRPDGRHRVGDLLGALPAAARTIFERLPQPLC